MSSPQIFTRYTLTNSLRQVLAVGQTACVGIATDKGLGRHIDAIPAEEIQSLSKVRTNNSLSIA